MPKKEGNLLNEQKGNQSSNVSFPMVALSRDSTVEIRLPLNCSLMCRHLKFYAASRLSSPPFLVSMESEAFWFVGKIENAT